MGGEGEGGGWHPKPVKLGKVEGPKVERKAGDQEELEAADKKHEKKAFGPLVKAEGKGHVWSSKHKGGDDKSFVTVLEGKYSVEALSGSVNLREGKGMLTVVDAEAEGTVVHGEFDFVDKIKHLLFHDPPKPAPPGPPPAPMAARVGDPTTHGAPLTGGPGSPNVFIGGMPAWRAGLDIHICPLAKGPAPDGPGPTIPGAPTVLINGAPAARAGDCVMEAVGGPDPILLGCPTVLIGPTAPPPPPSPRPPAPPETPWVKFEATGKGDFLHGEAHAKFIAEADVKKRELELAGQAGAEAAVLQGDLPLKLRLRIPFTSYYLGLGVTLHGSLLSAGAEAGGHATVNSHGKLLDLNGGAKVGAGIGGVGINFGLDVSK
jgi:uncharacterized Zn-binding protein involved in type VI secretion